MCKDINKQIGYLKKHLAPILIGTVQWLLQLLFKFDRRFLGYENVTGVYIVVKALYLLFLWAMWSFLFYVGEKYKKGDVMIRRGIKVFLCYFSILLVLMLVLWPGTWSADDIRVLEGACSYRLLPWQHIISSFVQMLFLQILPSAGGVILVQNFLIAICVSYIVVKFEFTILHNKKFGNNVYA